MKTSSFVPAGLVLAHIGGAIAFRLPSIVIGSITFNLDFPQSIGYGQSETTSPSGPTTAKSVASTSIQNASSARASSGTIGISASVKSASSSAPKSGIVTAPTISIRSTTGTSNGPPSSSMLASSKVNLSASASSRAASASLIGTSSGCTSTFFTTTTYSVVPSAVVITSTVTSASQTINGDDFDVRLSPTTITATTTVYTAVDQTLTTTQTSTPQTKIGSDSTVTIPAPTGFRPVQDTLPGAYLSNPLNQLNPVAKAKQKRQAQGSCQSRTVTISKTVIAATYTRTVTTTYTGAVIAFPLEGTTIAADQYTPPAVYSTIVTTTITSYASTSTVSVTASTTATVTATTTTVYAACATNNWADAINFPNGTSATIYQNFGGYSYGGVGTSAYECCVNSILNGAGVWIFGTDYQCFFAQNATAASCTPTSFDSSVWTGAVPGGADRIVGNSYCGFYGSSAPYPG